MVFFCEEKFLNEFSLGQINIASTALIQVLDRKICQEIWFNRQNYGCNFNGICASILMKHHKLVS